MFRKYRSTGNWAEDLGLAIEFFMKAAMLAFCLVPILIFAIIVLVATR